jgi:hypothetical protein
MKSEVGEKERRTRNPTARDRQPVMPFQGNKGVSTKTKKRERRDTRRSKIG